MYEILHSLFKIFPHPVTARLSVGLGTDSLEDWFDVRPGLGGSARHEGGAVASSIFSATHSTPHEMETFGGQSLAATLEGGRERGREGGREGEREREREGGGEEEEREREKEAK